MIISTGMASAHEIREAMDAAWNVQKAIPALCERLSNSG